MTRRADTDGTGTTLLVDAVRAALPGGHRRATGTGCVRYPRRWQDLTPRQQTAVLVLGSVQLSLAATAWADLAASPAEQVTGSKLRWALAIAVNWVGPLAWFRWGRRDRRAGYSRG
ncbi:hypothetical protein GCM10023328_41610 [Modestobacter marinus]|uniref:Cardiolipin synthase N-terminal domain-containing protein n=1 Tax=Modestobacter marinus TaxID=477641 RepID=A0A846LM35_9ACTN|nr:PLDc N-terminal domain-containing protein [Modestobacter marinus]NIH68537.1 hypothetical protein [Modestobacter marinus]GGL58004.1 hypothetical protein GCM10011589_12580 [Modestobacter marinus]